MTDSVPSMWIGALALAAGFWLGHWLTDLEPEQTCEAVAIELWAYRQCLNQAHACYVSPEGFIIFHELKTWEKEHCPESDGDYQP